MLYLKSDLEGLLEALTKFGDYTFKKYNLNITSFKTLSGLAFAAYLTSYLPDNLRSELKIVKGELEKEIRKSYFGGNVDVFANEITDGYLYDINSQYPTAMLNDMPIGDPVLSLETNINKIFGFIYGEITAPDEQTLKVPFIQYKDPITKLTVCPKGKFKRLILSEEIKYALKFGYKMDVEYCYQFKRGIDLFKDFVLDHYEIKKNSKDPVKISIAKLLLNTLYGRFGMKDIDSIMRIVDLDEAKYLDKNTNVSVLSELSDNKYFIKYKGKINDSLRKNYKNDPFISDIGQMIHYNRDDLRKSGLNKNLNVPSAVHIAAAIASYARIIINEYKNIPDNPCIMSDTDSAVLPYSLPDHLVGKELGKMKLVHKIKKGIFIKKKLYYILTSDNQEIIRSSGINSSRLSHESFIQLLQGETIFIERTTFNLDWDELSLNVVNSDIKIQGLQGEIKSFNYTPNKIAKININIPKLTTLELLIYFIFIFSILSLFALFLYKIYNL